MTVIFILRMFSHMLSVMLVRMSVIYVDNISHFGLLVCFRHIKRLNYYSKKMDPRHKLY